jgi:hypothetical protein
MNKGKNTLTILGFILFASGQLLGLSPRQLAKLRNLEKQLTARFNTDPGADPNTWAAGNQTIIGQIRQLDPRIAVSYQKQQDNLTREIRERIAAQQTREEVMGEASREKWERTDQADNILANVGEEISTLLNSLETPFQSETVFEMPTEEIQAIINNTEPILHRIEALLAAVSWQDASGKAKERLAKNMDDFFYFILTATLSKFNRHITALNDDKDFRNRNKGNFEKTAQAIRNMKIILNLYRRLPRVFGHMLTDQQVQEKENIIRLVEKDLSTFKRKLYNKYDAKVVYSGLFGRGGVDPTKVAIVTYEYDSDRNEWTPRAATAVEDLLQDIPPSVTEFIEEEEEEEEMKKKSAGTEEPERAGRELPPGVTSVRRGGRDVTADAKPVVVPDAESVSAEAKSASADAESVSADAESVSAEAEPVSADAEPDPLSLS